MSEPNAGGSGRMPSGTRSRPFRALVIEDAGDSRELWMSELNQAGFHVSAARDGEEGLRQAQAFQPDVIVLDLMLPELNGFGVARAVRSMERERKIAILAVSALTSEALRQMALDAGCDSFLAKPVTAASVVEAAIYLLRCRGALDAAREPR